MLDAVDRGWRDQIEFLRTLVSQRSVLGATNGAMEVAEPLLKDLGLFVDHVGIDVGRLRDLAGFSPPDWSYEGLYNLVGRKRGAGGGRSMVLNGHLDVVPSTPEEHWTHGPWDGEIVSDVMFGRGAADMKSGVTAMLFALRAIQEADRRLRGDVITQLVIDEECTGNGTLAVLAAGATGDACLIPEPFGMTMVSAHPGVLWARIRVRGRAAHAAYASRAVNSAEKMYVVLRALRELEEEMNAPDRQHPAFAGIDHPINFNVGKLHAGDWTSSVPEICEMEVRFACYPGESLDDVQQKFVECVADAARVDDWLQEMPPEVRFFGFRAEGVVYNTDNALARVVAANHQAVMGEPVERRPTTATVDNRFFDHHFGIPSICYGPRGGALHAPDEWVDLQSLHRCTEVIALTLLDWCGED